MILTKGHPLSFALQRYYSTTPAYLTRFKRQEMGLNAPVQLSAAHLQPQLFWAHRETDMKSRNLITALALCSIANIATAQSEFRFYAGEGLATTPVNAAPTPVTNPDYSGSPLTYQVDEFLLDVVGGNSQYAHCQAYQDMQPDFGGLGVFSDNSLWAWLCNNDEVDQYETLSLQFNQPVELSNWRFHADHQAIGAGVSANLSIDGQAQQVSLWALHNDASLSLTGTEFIFQGNGSGSFYLGGFQARSPEIVIEPGDCDGDTGCTLFDQYGFTSRITNAPEVAGSLRLKTPRTLIDPRTHCGGTGWHSTDLNLNELAGDTLTGAVILPAHLCGIPSLQTDGQYRPQITLLEVVAALNLREEMIQDELEEPASAGYQCASAAGDASAPYRHPLLTWLPRPNTDEIPVQDALGDTVHQVRVINIGCGSLRAGVGARSYLAYNLHYADGTNLLNVISAEISQLKATVNQAEACMMSNGVHTSTMSALVKSIESGFANRQYTNKVEPKLKALEAELNGARLRTPLAECYWDPASQQAVYAPAGTSLQPRNFRGDLLGQTLHLRYQLDAMVLLRAQGI